MAEDLILPVPETMSAVYLVPVALSPRAAQDLTVAGLAPVRAVPSPSPHG